MLTAIAIITIVLLFVSSLSTISLIGKERKPLTPGAASITVLIDLVLIIGLVYVIIAD
jgi:hypothetical protein